ncbi:MAG TPA: hypothetical protein VLS89_13930, partial [Candidatus Nanopelagicales bacterium]|nr:hypothetical protein [Candidatus Nanopelagicales bacterium]
KTIRRWIKKSPTFREIFEEGFEEGRRKAIEDMLRGLLMRHLERDLTPGEQQALADRVSVLDGPQTSEALRTLDGEGLHQWLFGPHDRTS